VESSAVSRPPSPRPFAPTKPTTFAARGPAG
jgi:hypothetical protein